MVRHRLGAGAQGKYVEGYLHLHSHIFVVNISTLRFPIATDNIVNWDRAVLIAAMIVGFEVDFPWLPLSMMNERAFKATTIYPFPCMVFAFCRLVGVPVWHIDVLKMPSGIISFGLIRDESNKLAPYGGPRPEVHPLGEKLAGMVEQAQAANLATFNSADTTPFESISGDSTAPRSSPSTSSSTLVPIVRVQKLEAQMAKLLHQIQPWMQRSIAEEEERLERKIPHARSERSWWSTIAWTRLNCGFLPNQTPQRM